MLVRVSISSIFGEFESRWSGSGIVFGTGSTEVEQKKAERRQDTAGTYAKRWAAKEACSKALGTGLRMGIAWKDMSVSNLRTGQPVMAVTGWAKDRLAKMTPEGHEAVIHVTLTDDHPWAQAFVVIEARPKGSPGSAGTSQET